jgi:hypothetical protein
MDEREFVTRKIKLKGQAIGLIRSERETLKHRLSLLHLRDSFLAQIKPTFDRELSAKLDCVDYLLRA